MVCNLVSSGSFQKGDGEIPFPFTIKQMVSDMTDPNISAADPKECAFVEFLTEDANGNLIGYRFGGERPGPNALVEGPREVLDAVAEKLAQLPTLRWMWGSLYLIQQGTAEQSRKLSGGEDQPDVFFDDFVSVSGSASPDPQSEEVQDVYWSTLRLCKGLGMIQGRGVS